MSVESLMPFESGRPVWRFSFGATLLAAVIAALSLVPFWDGLVDMWTIWTNFPEYSHSLLIPPLTAFLIWQHKDRLERESFTGSWWGVALIALAGAMLILGQLGTFYGLIEYGYLVFLWGMVLALTGARAFRLLVGPLGILLFMIPLPSFVFNNLSQKLQLLSSLIGASFIRLFGVSVYLEGNVIDLGGYKLQVAEACDGLRYLFPLLTLGFLMAYIYKGAVWKRVAVFLSSIPITVLMNSFRIGTIGLMVEHWGIGMAEGFLHEFQGWAVFMASALLMLGEIYALNAIGHENGTWRQLFGVELPAPSPKGAPRRRRTIPPAFLAACTLLAAYAAVSVALPRSAEIIPERTEFAAFPLTLGGWNGVPNSLDGVYLDALKLSDYFLADYRRESHPVNVYMAYYNSQRKGDAVHSPRACLPGGGWVLSDFDQVEINVGGKPLRVNRSIMTLGTNRELVYYWFDQRGRVITNELAVKWYLFYDALTRHRTDGALIRLVTDMPREGDATDADRRLTDIASQIVPLLPRFIPN
jgi:exosortase D (VPLPA-CTERM-specific)